MSEIFVEEENTVYEVDAECLKQKEKGEGRNEKKDLRFRAQGIKGNSWIIILFLLCICKE